MGALEQVDEFLGQYNSVIAPLLAKASELKVLVPSLEEELAALKDERDRIDKKTERVKSAIRVLKGFK